MAKKQKPDPRKQVAYTKQVDLERSIWFAPVSFGLIAVALTILFKEFIFSDRMLHMSDQIQAGVFFRMFLIDYVRDHGAFPQWMPFIFGGMPYIEAFHGDIFYPLSMMKFLASDFNDFVRIQGWVMIGHIYLAGIFMYLCARRFKLSKSASLLSAACYMFAAYLVSLVAPGHDGKIYVTTLFPLTFLCVEMGFESSRKLLWFSALGTVIGFIILSPHPQMSYFVLIAVSLFALFKLVMLYFKHRALVPLIKPGVLMAYAVAIGLTLSAIQFYPGYHYTTNFSPRADTKQGWAWATSWSMHEEEAMSLLVPEFSGTSAGDTKTYYWGKNPFKDNSEYVGIVALFMALLGLFISRRRERYFFAGLGLFALFYALGSTTPLFYIFFHLIPKVKSMRAPSMVMFIFSFSVAMLAGFAIQALLDTRNRISEMSSRAFSYVVLGFPGLMFLLALALAANGRGMISLWTSIFHSRAATTQIQQGVTKLDLAYLNLPAVQSGAWIAFLFMTMAAVCVWLYKTGRASNVILPGLALLAVFDSARFDSRFVTTSNQAKYWQQNPMAMISPRESEPFRVMNFGVMPEDLLPFFKTDVVVGYHGNQLRWYDDLLGGPGKTNQGNPRFLNLAGAKFLCMPVNATVPDGYFGPKLTTRVTTIGNMQIIQNDNALPRLALYDNYAVIADRKEIVDSVLKGSDDLSKIVYLEKAPQLEILPDSLNSDSAWFLDYQNDMIKIGLKVSQSKLLVLTDNYYNAWQVSVDGQPAELLRAFGSFRAVEIPAGSSEVRFEFYSQRYATGKWLTTLTSFYLLAIFGFYFVIARRGGSKED